MILNNKSRDEMQEKVYDTLSFVYDTFGREESLKIIANILNDYDLVTASNLVKADCEPCITKNYYQDKHFDEGNEEAGFTGLKELLTDIETILNCDDSSSDIKFTEFIRLETDVEKEESGHSLSVEWFISDVSHSIKDTYIGFEDV